MHAVARWSLFVAAAAMPAVAWLVRAGAFGGDVGEASSRFPTLLVPAGYAFAIWGPIFLLGVMFAAWQLPAARGNDGSLRRLRPWATAGFALTALWTPVFLAQAYVGAVLVIWASLATVLAGAVLAARAPGSSAAATPLPRIALALHAGWLTLAAFVNTAQLLLATGFTTQADQWPASAALWLAAALVLLAAQRALSPAPAALLAYSAAAAWGLVAVYFRQSAATLPGGAVSANVAAALFLVVGLHAGWLLRGGAARAPLRAR